ncbi:MAG: PspC domain-containing protein [Acidimicrobiia bacterium]
MNAPRWRDRSRLPRVHRSNDRLVAGVAGGWADRWGVEPTVVRASIGLLTLAGGVGVGMYAIGALLSEPAARPALPAAMPRSDRHRRGAAIACMTAALAIALRAVGLWPGDGVMIPAAAAAAGIAVAWSRSAAPSTLLASHGWAWQVVRIVAGVGLLAAGVLSLASRTGGLASVGASASAIAVVIGGLAMFAAPAFGRVLRTLDDERSMRIREDERSVVAAHLHDSVLQSLVMIQRTDDPRRMANLARREERELRAWLYGSVPVGEPTSLHQAVDALIVEIERDHDVRVEAVVVGDQPLDDSARVLIASLREAIVNAARHAGVARIDVFIDADDAELSGFVRDTGTGFDPAVVPEDRRGVRDSIIGRVRRAGGTAVLTTSVGVGTEVELRIPRRRPSTS